VALRSNGPPARSDEEHICIDTCGGSNAADPAHFNSENPRPAPVFGWSFVAKRVKDHSGYSISRIRASNQIRCKRHTQSLIGVQRKINATIRQSRFSHVWGARDSKPVLRSCRYWIQPGPGSASHAANGLKPLAITWSESLVPFRACAA